MIYSENILICMIVPLLVMLPFLPVKSRRLFIGLILGMAMCLFGAYLNGFFGEYLEMNADEIAKYIAPIVEELMKMLPIMIYLLLLQPTISDLFAFSVVIGAGFATFENCCYIVFNGAQLFSFILIRGLAVGIMHVACGLALGMGASLIMRDRRTMIPGTIGAFSFAMTIHALYNLLVSVEGVPTYIGYSIPIIALIIIYFMWNRQKNLSGLQP